MIFFCEEHPVLSLIIALIVALAITPRNALYWQPRHVPRAAPEGKPGRRDGRAVADGSPIVNGRGHAPAERYNRSLDQAPSGFQGLADRSQYMSPSLSPVQGVRMLSFLIALIIALAVTPADPFY
jgi:hypothetical protein